MYKYYLGIIKEKEHNPLMIVFLLLTLHRKKIVTDMKILPSLLFAALISTSCNEVSAVKNLFSSSEDNKEVTSDTINSSILFVGDLMQHSTQFKSALACGGGKTYNYDATFEFVKPKVSAATLAIGNLEVTLGGEPYSGYPCFSAPDEYLYAIKDAGFDAVTTANNHCCDRGEKGLDRTLEILDKAKVPSCGTYTDSLSREKRYPLILDAGGIKVCLLTYTYGTNGLPVPKGHIVNLIDKEMMAKDIKKAKTMNADIILASVHWGVENVTKENEEQRELAQWLVDQGVDHVIGGHPHMIQPSTYIDGKDGKKHYVVYSLGNYVSNMQRPNNKIGLTITMNFQKVTTNGKSTTTLLGVDEEKTYCSFPAINPTKNYRIIPASVPDSKLSEAEQKARVGSLQKEPLQDKPAASGQKKVVRKKRK